MPWRNRFFAAVWLFLLFPSVSFSAQMSFRTPAKILGNRFTVKVEFSQGSMKYVVPFWVDPQEKFSFLDEKMMKEAGWQGKNRVWDEVKLSGHSIPLTRLKNGDSEDAFLPDYTKTCCYGTLGRDFLNQYQVVAFEDNPAYIEWYKVDPSSESKPSWFVRERDYPWMTLKAPVFTFQLKAPDRKAYLTRSWKNIPANAHWTRVQGKDPAGLDRFLLENYLKGKVDQEIELKFQVGKTEKTVIQEFTWKPRN